MARQTFASRVDRNPEGPPKTATAGLPGHRIGAKRTTFTM